MNGGWRVSTGECPCGQGRKRTTFSCTDPAPKYGGALCNCNEAAIGTATQTLLCDGHNATIENDCQNEPCPGTSICIENHINMLLHKKELKCFNRVYIKICFTVCDVIEVRSTGNASKLQASKMGIYKKENYNVNGKRVFKHAERDAFLYKDDRGGDWMVILIL